MKRVSFVVIGVLLASVALSVGCTKTTTPPPATTQNVTGVLTGVNTPAEPGADFITVQTPQGTQIFIPAANTTYTLDGKVCTLDDINKVMAEGNATYQCNVVEDEALGVLNSLSVWTQVK